MAWERVVLPAALLLDSDIRQDAAQVGLLFAETMLFNQGVTDLVKATVLRPRPYLYTDGLPDNMPVEAFDRTLGRPQPVRVMPPASSIRPSRTFPATRVIPALLLLYVGLTLYGLGSWGLVETSEARYAEMGREMHLSRDFLHPTILGVRHYHKPPFTYAATAVAYDLFGESPWSARIFLQLGLWLQLFFVYRIGRLLLPDRRAAWWATAVYASFPILLIAARNLTTDLYLNTFLLAGVWAFLRSERERRPVGWLLGAYFVWGLAALTKGAGVVILPAVLLPAWYLLHPPASWWRLIGRHALGVLIFLPVGLSWYGALIAEDGSLLQYFLVEQTIHRYTSDQWSRDQPAWFYLLTVTATTFPWLFALLGFGRRWRELRAKRATVIWLAAWFMVPILFYSFAQSKLILYVLPAYAGLALLASYWLGAASAGAMVRWSRIARGFFTLVFAALFVAPLATDLVAGSPAYYLFLVLALAALWLLPQRLMDTAPNGAGRLVTTALLFSLLLLPVGTQFLSHNELLVNSPARVVSQLQDQGLSAHHAYSLDRELPAVAFGLGAPLHQLYTGEMTRDTSWEINADWRQGWIDVDGRATRDSLAGRWTAEPTLVITYRTPPDSLRYWLEQLGHRDSLGPYTYYYNFPPDR